MTLSDDKMANHSSPPASPLPFERPHKFSFHVGLAVALLSLISGFSTYLILSGLTPLAPTHDVVVTVLVINFILVLSMVAVIAWQVINLWQARKRQAAGAKLHVRIVALFSVVAVLPTILLAILASISLDRGLDHWFSKRTKTIIQNSIDVALAYVDEHGQVIRADIVNMAKDLDQVGPLMSSDPQRFHDFLKRQAIVRALPQVFLVNENGRVLWAAVSSKLRKSPYFPPSRRALLRAKKGEVVIISPGTTNWGRALKKLDNHPDKYLYVLRQMNPIVIRHLSRTRDRVAEYDTFEKRRAGLQNAFALVFLVIALTLLLAAIWLGFWFANRLVTPIRRLIGAAQNVSEGNLDIQLKVKSKEGDLANLSETFNNMTTKLKDQRNELVDTNAMLDDRRRFIETVLSGVSAGVVGLNSEGIITLVNRSAEDLLNCDQESLINQPLEERVPEFFHLFTKAQEQGSKALVQDHINLFRAGREYNFAARLSPELTYGHRTTDKTEENQKAGYVLTFDDVSELVSAQRSSAWADIARRIAHEIKNPLTPIQLSAERVRRKYSDQIHKDRDVFEKCTETIIRQVGDIGRMVDEFSSFARMPKAKMEDADIGDIVKQAVFLFHVGHPEIDFEVDVPETPVASLCDRRLLSQAVTNLVKNASEAVHAAEKAQSSTAPFKGHIVSRLSVSGANYVIEVIDNGCGLPKKDRNRLTEPYMTTREKGTGLGLAIVQKITEQHGGTLSLVDVSRDKNDAKGGACVRLTFPISRKEDKTGLSPESLNGQTSKPEDAEIHLDQQDRDHLNL